MVRQKLQGPQKPYNVKALSLQIFYCVSLSGRTLGFVCERAVMNLVQRFAARKTLDTLASGLSAMRVGRAPPAPSAAKAPAWIFLGPPGVGKGTYSSRVASALGVPHVAAGDLVRDQIKNKTEFGIKVSTALSFTLVQGTMPLPHKLASSAVPDTVCISARHRTSWPGEIFCQMR